jgi:hypothetical protein
MKSQDKETIAILNSIEHRYKFLFLYFLAVSRHFLQSLHKYFYKKVVNSERFRYFSSFIIGVLLVLAF